MRVLHVNNNISQFRQFQATQSRTLLFRSFGSKMDKSKMGDLLGRLGKVPGRGVGIGVQLLIGAGGLAYGVSQAMYTGKVHAFLPICWVWNESEVSHSGRRSSRHHIQPDRRHPKWGVRRGTALQVRWTPMYFLVLAPVFLILFPPSVCTVSWAHYRLQIKFFYHFKSSSRTNMDYGCSSWGEGGLFSESKME